MLFFLYSSGEYKVLNQYYVYDTGDFLADIGGYMVSPNNCLNTSLSPQPNQFQGLCLGMGLPKFYDLTVTGLSKLFEKCLSQDQDGSQNMQE